MTALGTEILLSSKIRPEIRTEIPRLVGVGLTEAWICIDLAPEAIGADAEAVTSSSTQGRSHRRA